MNLAFNRASSKKNQTAENMQLMIPVYQLKISPKAIENASRRPDLPFKILYVPRIASGSMTAPSSHMQLQVWDIMYWERP